MADWKTDNPVVGYMIEALKDQLAEIHSLENTLLEERSHLEQHLEAVDSSLEAVAEAEGFTVHALQRLTEGAFA